MGRTRRDRDADRLMLRLLHRAGWWNVLLAAAGLAGVGAGIAFPAVLAGIVDGVRQTGAPGQDGPGRYALAACWLILISVAASAASELAAAAASVRSVGWLRHRLLAQVLALGPRRPAEFTSGQVTARLVGNAAEAARVTPMAAWCALSFLPAVGALVALVEIEPLLALVFVAGTPVLLGIVRLLLRRSSSAATEYLRIQGDIGAKLVDALAGARTIAAAATQDREVARVLGQLPELRRHGRDSWLASAGSAAAGRVTGPLVQVAVLAVAGLLLSRGRISAGGMIAASQYALLAAALPAPLAFVARFARARAGAARVAEVLAVEPPGYGHRTLPPPAVVARSAVPSPVRSPAVVPAPVGAVEFRQVTVRAAGQRVLDGLDLAVPAGTLLAVVGRSGAGKSTLAALVGRLLDADAGEVLLDGVPVRELSRAELRRAVAYGFDRPELVGGSVAEVISLGWPATSAETARAARAACADGFIRRLPDGYGTPMVDAPLSGGEAQRLGLARAFARPARVLVLDDATSNLDTMTEAQISAVLTGQLRGRTRFVVAHRAGTAARADLVAWLDGGKIRALAPHSRLWRDGAYRKVFAP